MLLEAVEGSPPEVLQGDVEDSPQEVLPGAVVDSPPEEAEGEEDTNKSYFYPLFVILLLNLLDNEECFLRRNHDIEMIVFPDSSFCYFGLLRGLEIVSFY